MTNVLNSIIANQPMNNSVNGAAAFTVDTKGKIKPLEDKGRLLPSRVFGSPVEYVKDLKKDVVNIGRAANGKANDHELGRINDVAMKLGSLALAAYLFVKNPLKLSKTMEFVGFGTFFGSMALWPKIAIQAPIKARTGVDIHQKYIDSQNRKKMLFQDPQYDLTDMFSREDLDKMGKKLKVKENLPDRDRFIKQRAKKTAVQGNTLWMLSAGLASPVMSALACNVMEKPLNKAFETSALKSTQKALEKNIGNLAKSNNTAVLESFLAKNANAVVDNNVINNLADNLLPDVNSGEFKKEIIKYIKSLLNNAKQAVTMDEAFVSNALNGNIAEGLLSSLTEAQRAALNTAMEKGSIKNVAQTLAAAAGGNKAQQMKQAKLYMGLLEKACAAKKPVLGDISAKLLDLNSALVQFSSDKKVLDDFVSARVGEKAGSYIANQWERVTNKLVKSLKFNNAQLKELQNGNIDVLIQGIEKVVNNENPYGSGILNKFMNSSKNSNNNAIKFIRELVEYRCGKKYDRLISNLIAMAGEYEEVTGADVISSVQQKTKTICEAAKNSLNDKGISSLAEKMMSDSTAGTLENTINTQIKERTIGARASFYRLIQLIDVIKKEKDGTLAKTIEESLKNMGKDSSQGSVDRLVQICKNILFEATPTDYAEKLTNSRYKLDKDEFKIISNILFGNSDESIRAGLNSLQGDTLLNRVLSKIPFIKNYVEKYNRAGGQGLSGLNDYKKEFMEKVINWENGMTPELSRNINGTPTHSLNAIERSGYVGKPIKSMLQETAEKVYNSRKWLKIFGGAMVVITAATLIAGLMVGRKSKIEKQTEENIK